MAGPAIRCSEMAKALSDAGHEVHLGAPFTSDRAVEGYQLVMADERSLAVEEAWADVLVVQGFVLSNHPTLATTSKYLVVDLYDPFVLENLEMYADLPLGARQREHWPALATTSVQLRIGDFFLCANERQRDFWLGCLVSEDRVNPITHMQDGLMRRLIDIVPFGCPNHPPRHSGIPAVRGVLPGVGEMDKVAIWAGGVYNWFDPLSLIRAWPGVLRQVPNARLIFMGMKHPNPMVPEMRMASEAIRLSEELNLRDRAVAFNLGWVPYDSRQDYLLESDIGVSTHFNHLETRLSFRTRVLDYIWTGLPAVVTEGDSFAELIDRNGGGRVVPYEDPRALETAISEILGNDGVRNRCAEVVANMRSDFTWARALEPLVRYCNDPWRAADLQERRRRPGRDQPPGSAVPRAYWFLRREGANQFARRAIGKLTKVVRARRKRNRKLSNRPLE